MEFRQFSQQDTQETVIKWDEEASRYDCFPDEVHQKLAPLTKPAATGAEDKRNKTLHYGVFLDGRHDAIALCEMVLSDRGTIGGKWLKMLKLTMSPEVDTQVIEDHPGAIDTVVQAYRTAVIGAFSERMNHEADTLKLYGRSEEQLKFLVLLIAFINQDHGHELVATKEGRWLVVRSTSKQQPGVPE